MPRPESNKNELPMLLTYVNFFGRKGPRVQDERDSISTPEPEQRVLLGKADFLHFPGIFREEF